MAGAATAAAGAGGVPAAGRLAAASSSSASSTPRTSCIEVGVAIVGGGTAGLACANRLLQLLADDRGAAGALGEVPVAVIEKAKTCGGHNLSGAVMRPGPLEELFPDLTPRGLAQGGLRLRRGRQGGRLPAADRQARAADPAAAAVQEPRQRGHLGRRAGALPAAQAEEAGAYILTETAATQLLVEDGARRRRALRRQGPRQGRRAAAATSSPAPTSGAARPCSPRAAGATSPAPRSASSTSPTGREPQVWELGVKEVWKVPKPLDRLIHTIGPWPLKLSSKYGQIGGTWIYPMKDEKTGDDLVSIGFVVDLEYADATTSAHDLLQQFKLHPLVERSSRAASASAGAPRRCRAAATGRCRS